MRRIYEQRVDQRTCRQNLIFIRRVLQPLQFHGRTYIAAACVVNIRIAHCSCTGNEKVFQLRGSHADTIDVEADTRTKEEAVREIDRCATRESYSGFLRAPCDGRYGEVEQFPARGACTQQFYCRTN